MTANDDYSEKMAEAADELIKVIQAASTHVNSSMLALNREAVEALQQWYVQAASVTDSITLLKESQEVSANAMIESIANVDQRLANVESSFANGLATDRESVEALHQWSIQTPSVKDSRSETLLKELQEANTNAMIQFTTNIEQRLANFELRFANVEGHLVTSNQSMAAQSKKQTLEWAITNASLYSFGYFKKPNSDHSVEHKLPSNSLVTGILLSFRQNKGYFIDNFSLTLYNDRSAETITKGEKDFREALVNQIHALIGQEPRIAMSEGRWAIYYS